MEITKCTIDLTTCDTQDNIRIKNFCDGMKSVNSLWTPLVENIHPPIKCPPKKVSPSLTQYSF